MAETSDYYAIVEEQHRRLVEAIDSYLDDAPGTPHGLPLPYPGWPEHRYIYSTEDGDSCSCGWAPRSFRTEPDEWATHVAEATEVASR